MLKLVVLAAIVSLGAGAANAAHTPPAPPAIPPLLAAPAKAHELYTVDTNLSGYNPLTSEYNATIRITSNPCPHVNYDNTLSNIAKDADDALAQAHDQLAKIERDIHKSADQCHAQ